MRILLTANSSFALVNFRLGLIRALRAAGHDLIALVPEDDYTQRLREEGCVVETFGLDRRGTSIVKEIRTFLAVRDAIRRHAPDVILGYTIKPNLYAGVAARWRKTPMIPNVTGLGSIFLKPSLLQRGVVAAYRYAFPRSRMVFFQNDEDFALFEKNRIVRREASTVLPGSGVNLMHFAEAPIPDLSNGPVFLLTARLLWEKGIGEYVEAGRRVREEIPNARFQLLGSVESPGASAVSAADLAAWQSEGVIEYLGTTADVRPAIAASHCVVLPSYYPEGTPRSLLEAAAMGRPIITTDRPGCRRAVIDGVSGYLVEPRSVNDLYDKMMRIACSSVEEITNMGAEGRSLMEREFDERIVIDAYMRVIDGISPQK